MTSGRISFSETQPVLSGWKSNHHCTVRRQVHFSTTAHGIFVLVEVRIKIREASNTLPFSPDKETGDFPSVKHGSLLRHLLVYRYCVATELS